MERIISEYMRFFAEISYDKWPDSPRTRDNVGTMLYMEHPCYTLGDELLPDDWEDVVDGKVWIPYYAYTHSGVTISWRPFSDPWDSVVAGVIYADREEARKTFGLATDEEIIKALCSELETYAQYVEGAVYCTTIYRVPDGADPETVATDECEMLDGVCDQYDYSGFVLPGAKDTLAHYESVTPIQLSLFEEA